MDYFYLNKTGKVFTELDIMRAFELIYGINPVGADMYEGFKAGIIYGKKRRTNEPKESTINWLIEHGDRVHATKMYSQLYHTTVREAFEAIKELCEIERKAV